jgi:hypothetical protein
LLISVSPHVLHNRANWRTSLWGILGIEFPGSQALISPSSSRSKYTLYTYAYKNSLKGKIRVSCLSTIAG